MEDQIHKRVNMRTDVPGMRSMELLDVQRGRESGAVTYARRLPIAIKRAYGSYIHDMDGNVLIDFLTGAGSLPLGHSHPEVASAASEQLFEFVHGLDFPSESKHRFHDAVLSMLPAPIRDNYKIHFCGPTGADAVEAALKLCKIYTGADEVISFQGGYHGSTIGALSVTGLRSAKQDIGNRMPGVHFFPFSNCTSCPLGLQRQSCEVNCATYLERTLADANSGLGRTAAVLLEMVQGEGGVVPIHPVFARRVREMTLRHGIPLIVDEIQTGCGRTGTWFAFEQYGIEPDVITVSKGLSGIGLPVSLLLYRKNMDVWKSGAHIGTFRGNQAAFAAGAKAMEIIIRDAVLENVAERSLQIFDALHQMEKDFSIVRHVRGRGLMIGFDVVTTSSGKPDQRLAERIQCLALAKGLIIELGGREDTTVRLLPALNVPHAVVDEAMAILRDVIADADKWQEKRGSDLCNDYII